MLILNEPSLRQFILTTITLFIFYSTLLFTQNSSDSDKQLFDKYITTSAE